MLVAMETPANERRYIEEYLRSQSGPDFIIEHVEKLTTEHVLGREYDVWDAHTNEGRWWLITNPTNLYSQDLIKSMDIALSFHIGLMSRMEARDSVRFSRGGTKMWVLEILRRQESASDSLDRAKEVEDVQAVGMRLRENLLTLIERFHDLSLEMPEGIELPKQEGNFKGWADIYAGLLSPGSSLRNLRKLLKSQSDCTWEYLGWLTHARNATVTDGRIAWLATDALINTFLFATARMESGSIARCPLCASYQLSRELSEDRDWIQCCSTCGWSEPTDPPAPVDREYQSADEQSQQVSGDCAVPQDFGIYLTPDQVRSNLEEETTQTADQDGQPRWTNPFAFRFPEDNSVHDVHRLVFHSFNHEPSSGAELVYECEDDNCVNPGHAKEEPLPNGLNWSPMIVEQVVMSRPSYLDMTIGSQAKGRIHLSIKDDILNRHGLGDASSLLERVLVVSEPDDSGRVSIILSDRRVDFHHSTIISGKMQSSPGGNSE